MDKHIFVSLLKADHSKEFAAACAFKNNNLNDEEREKYIKRKAPETERKGELAISRRKKPGK